MSSISAPTLTTPGGGAPRLTLAEYSVFLSRVEHSKLKAKIQMYADVDRYLEEMYSSVIANANKIILKDFGVDPATLLQPQNINIESNQKIAQKVVEKMEVPLDPSFVSAQLEIMKSGKNEEIELIDLDEEGSEDDEDEEVNETDSPVDLSATSFSNDNAAAFCITQMSPQNNNSLLNLSGAQKSSTPRSVKRTRIESVEELSFNDDNGNYASSNSEDEEYELKSKFDSQQSQMAMDNPLQMAFGGVKQNILGLTLKCLRDDCDKQFAHKYQWNAHMKEEHAILGSRCLQRGCNKSFTTGDLLSEHFRSDHPLATEWNCPKCDKTFKRYPLLYRHFQCTHQEGVYKCATDPACTFLAETRGQVYAHQKSTHQTYVCNFDKCGKSFKQIGNLRRHQRVHSCLKPYRCTWEGCRYASAFRSTAINHIRMIHFGLPSTKKAMKEQQIVDQRDPRQHLMVMQELLNLQETNEQFGQL